MLKGLLARLQRHVAAPAELVAAGNRAEREGRLDEACRLYRAAMAVDPAHVPARLNLGAALEAAGDLHGAERAYREVLGIDAKNPYARYNLANVASARGTSEAAVDLLRAALHSKPDFPEAHVALSNALDALGQAEEALRHLRIALEQRPDYVGAWMNCAIVLQRLERMDEAEDALRRVLELDSQAANAYAQLGALLRGEGRIDESLETYGAARSRGLSSLALESAEMHTLLYSDALSDAEIFARHRDFGARLEAASPRLAPRAPAGEARERPLRIGYVSADLYRHPVALFLIPVLERHDRVAFRVTCYSTGTHADEVTAELRRSCDAWRECAALSDEALAQAIRADGIDILVDLTGHAGPCRLGAFARRPAPVQVSWLGYLHSTGLRAVDYRLCDAQTDPPGQAEALHTETLARLPHSQWCYRSFLTLDTAAPPCETKGFVTFGSFNHCGKISPTTRRQWRAILAGCPDARLVLVGIPPGRVSEQLLADLGGERSRVTLVPRVLLDEYFRWYNEVDIALDTFPYSGGTTSCDALWMGVPVVSAPGSRSVSRSSASLLRTVGLGDWVASADGYAALAIAKARDRSALAKLRGELRARLRASPLMDEPGFTNELEAAYRGMWHKWCDHGAARLV